VEERDAITKLERGEWIVKLAGRFTKPFMIKSDGFPVDKSVSDEEISEKMKPILHSLRKVRENKDPERRDEELQPISDDALRLLLNVNTHPFTGIATRIKELAIPASRLERAKKELISRKFVAQMEIPLTGRRPTSFLVLGDLGLEYLESKGKDTSLWRHVGHVGFEHVLYQVLIRWQIQKLGYTGHIEYRIGNRRIDVLAENGETRIGFEVELNPSPEIRGKLNGIEALTELYIVTRKDLLDSIAASIGPFPEKVGICSIENLLSELRNLVSEYSRNTSDNWNELETNVFSKNHEDSGQTIGKEIDSDWGSDSW